MMAQKQRRMSLKRLQPFFDLPVRPTKTDKWWKFSTSAFFIGFCWNLVWGLIMPQKQHRMSLKCLRPFSDLPARPTKPDQQWKFSSTAFFIRFGRNLVWGLIMNQKQHRISLKCLRQFSDLPAWPTQTDHRLQPFFSPLADSPHKSVADHYSFQIFLNCKNEGFSSCMSSGRSSNITEK